MNGLLKDWRQYCLGEKDFNSCHFNYLFDGADDNFQVEEIFRYFPESDDLVERFRLDVPEEYKKLASGQLDHHLDILVRKDIETKLVALYEFKKLESANKIENLPVEFTRSREVFDEIRCDDLNTIYKESFSDYMISLVNTSGDKVSRLIEALYWYSSDYDMIWYYLEPLVNIDIDLRNYRYIRGLKSNYCIGDENILIFKPR